MSFSTDLALGLLPVGLAAGASALHNKDANNTGADDAFASVLFELAPIAPALIAGRNPGDSALDKAFLTIHEVAGTYLRARGKLPSQLTLSPASS